VGYPTTSAAGRVGFIGFGCTLLVFPRAGFVADALLWFILGSVVLGFCAGGRVWFCEG